jgi:4-hydroxy-2-oxoheptanedioate aldolase
MHQELRDAIERIKDAAHKEGKKVGIYCTSGEQSRGFAEMGFDMISIAADMLAVQAHFAETLAVAKGEGKKGGAGGTGYDGR